MRHHRGFTYVEMAIVLLFMTIIGGIGAATLTGAREQATDQIAKSQIEAAVTAQVSYLQSYGTYAVTPEQLDSISIEGITFTTSPSTDDSTVNITELTDGIGIAVAVDDERCAVTQLDSLGDGPAPSIIATTNTSECIGSAGGAQP